MFPAAEREDEQRGADDDERSRGEEGAQAVGVAAVAEQVGEKQEEGEYQLEDDSHRVAPAEGARGEIPGGEANPYRQEIAVCAFTAKREGENQRVACGKSSPGVVLVVIIAATLPLPQKQGEQRQHIGQILPAPEHIRRVQEAAKRMEAQDVREQSDEKGDCPAARQKRQR